MTRKDKHWPVHTAHVPELPEGVKVTAGNSELWSVKVNAAPEQPSSGIVAVTVPESVMVPSKYMVGEPVEIAHRFFDDIGQLWRNYEQMADGEFRPGPVALALEILNAVRLVGPAVGISRNHDAYIALLAASELLMATQQTKTPRQYYSHIFRSYVVSYTEQGAGLVSDRRGRVLSKTELRELVLPSIAQHGKFLPGGGTATVERIYDWSRGHKVAEPAHVNLGLDAMTDSEFEARVGRDLRTIEKIARLSSRQ